MLNIALIECFPLACEIASSVTAFSRYRSFIPFPPRNDVCGMCFLVHDRRHVNCGSPLATPPSSARSTRLRPKHLQHLILLPPADLHGTSVRQMQRIPVCTHTRNEIGRASCRERV